MKERLDVLLVKHGHARSRERAKSIIMSGCVYVNGQKEDKAGTFFKEEGLRLEVRGSALKYVSRGGLKLEKALDKWQIDLSGAICMDIGASTGGFTDCMLQNGARQVYAIDVGHGQLAWQLRQDERVICMEKTNFRYVRREDVAQEFDFASADVSFISLTKILMPARNLLKGQGKLVCLIKPQFEAGRDTVGKKGVVREAGIHKEVIGKIVDFAGGIGFDVLDLDFSPIKGPEGNIEYLLYLCKDEERSTSYHEQKESDAISYLEELDRNESGLSQKEEWRMRINETVSRAHDALRSGKTKQSEGDSEE